MYPRTKALMSSVFVVGVAVCQSVRAQHDPAITPELYAVVCDAAVGALPEPLPGCTSASHRDAIHAIAVSGAGCHAIRRIVERTLHAALGRPPTTSSGWMPRCRPTVMRTPA